MHKPKVSILMTVFNSETRLLRFTQRFLLADAIESLLDQTFQDFELIILDNLSDDATYEFCQSLAVKDKRVKVFRDNKRTNTEEAFGKLLRLSVGEFVVFANDDDLWEKNYLEVLVSASQNSPDVDLYFCNAYSIDLEDKLIHKITKTKDEQVYGFENPPILRVSQYFLNRNPLPKIFGMFKRESLEQVMPLKTFDDLGADMDNLFFIKFFAQGMRSEMIDVALFKYRERPRPLGVLGEKQSLSDSDLGMEIQRYLNHQVDFYIQSCREVLNQFKRNEAAFFLAFAFEGFLKHTFEKLSWLNTNYSSGYVASRSIEKLMATLKRTLSDLPVKIADYNFSPNQNETEKLIFCDETFTESQLAFASEQLELIHNGIEEICVNFHVDNSLCRFNDLTQIYSDSFIEGQEELLKSSQKKLNSSTPQISVLVTSMNLRKYIRETILSIESQERVQTKILVADGGSTDDSLDELYKFTTVNIVSLKDDGFVDGVNKALQEVNSPYTAQCCISDSYASKLWLYEATSFLEKHPEVSLVWGYPRYQSENGTLGPISYGEFLFSETPVLSKMYVDWLSSGFYFPEGNFVCRTEVFRSCFVTRSEFELNPVEAFLEFTARFHKNGYLSSHIPTIANYGRAHDNQSGAMLTKSGSMKKFHRDYQRKIRLERRAFLVRRKKIFINSEGVVVEELKLTSGVLLRTFFKGGISKISDFVSLIKSLIPVKYKTEIKSLLFKFGKYQR
jgi:glycosyltransferase involved in cell wall biosynthesis